MIISIVKFKFGGQMSPDEYRAFLMKVMPRYQNAQGLNVKYFLRNSEGESGGVYEWESQEAADAYFNETWHAEMDEVAEWHSVEFYSTNAKLNNADDKLEVFV